MSLPPPLIIPAVTSALCDLLHRAVGHTGATVTTLRPSAVPDSGMAVNLFFYQCTPNLSFRNEDVPTRNAQGELLEQPAAAVDLHYLVTFHGKESDLAPQTLLELSWARLHAEPVLQIPIPKEAVAVGRTAEAPEVRVTPAAATFEDLHRLWSVFPQSAYSLSALLEAGPVFLLEPVVAIEPKRVEKREVQASLHLPADARKSGGKG
jgi:hypothetical protein